MRIGQLVLLVLFSTHWTSVSLWDDKYILNFLAPLYKVMQLQDIIWFLSESLDTSATKHLQEFTVSLHHVTGLPQMVITNRSDLRIIKTDAKRSYSAIVITTGPTDVIMDIHDKVLKGRHFFFSFIINTQTVVDFNVVRRFVEDMHYRNFMNSLLYYRTENGMNELWGYSIYPRFELENRTNFMAYFRKAYKQMVSGGNDVLGYTFVTPLRQDLPHVFEYKHSEGYTEIQGISFRIFKLFLDYSNGTLADYNMPPDSLGGNVINMQKTLDLVRERKIDISAHAYALFSIDDDIDKSYPIMVVKWCLMVPIRNKVSTLYYPVQPFQLEVWYSILLAFLGLMLINLLWTALEFSPTPHIRLQFVQALLNSAMNDYCLILNLPATRTLQTPMWQRFFVYTCIFLYSFFLTANYTSLLGSFLTVTLFRAQINTMDDLISENITVLIIDYEYDFLLGAENDLPSRFLHLLKPVDVATYAQHQISLNTTYAYFVTEEKWHFLALQQRNLKIGLFKFSDICFGSYHLGFPMQLDSPIWRSLEYFLYRVHSSGLLEHYESMSFYYAVHAGMVKQLVNTNDYESAGLKHLKIIFMMLIGVACISFIILLFECFIYRFLRNKNFHKSK